MSHGKIRTEKICLNCGTETPGLYCPACGQLNIEPKQSVWQLIHHFFSDITHFDGKFFETVKDLFAKPGFLSREYMMGRRASYLDPIRMYIFTSAFFFLIFFSLYDVRKLHIGEDDVTEIKKDPDLGQIINKARITVDSVRAAEEDETPGKPFVKTNHDSTRVKKGLKMSLGETEFTTVEAYDSAQKTMPVSKRDGWIKKRLKLRNIELKQRYAKDRGALFKDLGSAFLHNFPKMLFISLPAFAFILKLLYIRRKQFYYVDHGIFSIHLYIYSFLVLLVFFAFNQLQTYTGWGWLFWLIAAILIYPFVYYYKSMRRFYGQSRAKTFLKYCLLFMLSFFVQLIIFICFVLFTVYEA